MNASDLEMLVRDLGFTKIRIVNNASDTNVMVCCPYHGERNPSMGISAEKECFGCFACGERGTLVELVMYMKECSFSKAKDYLEEKFNVNMKTFEREGELRRYEDDILIQLSEVLPYYKLAPYKSGKLFHQYLLNRGFTKGTLKKFLIGWDRTKARITIPIFNEKTELLGFLGRAVLEPKIEGKDNPEYKVIYGEADRYLVYEFKKSHALFPIHLFKPIDDTVILVEGSLDAMWMHQKGFTNVLSSLGAKLSKEQLELIYKLKVKKVVVMYDNDFAGEQGKESAYKLLKNDFIVYNTSFLKDRNDPQECSNEELNQILQNKKYFNTLSLKKID